MPWDARHAAAGPPGAPDAFVERALAFLAREKVRPARALDLASGRGRHALLLAERGFAVEAVDSSPVALERLAAEAARRELVLATRVFDLEGVALPDVEPVELALVVDFLHRPLLASLRALVLPGGHALVATFTTDREGEHPRESFCLAPFELARGLPGFTTLLAEERAGRAGILARRASTNPPRRVRL